MVPLAQPDPVIVLVGRLQGAEPGLDGRGGVVEQPEFPEHGARVRRSAPRRASTRRTSSSLPSKR